MVEKETSTINSKPSSEEKKVEVLDTDVKAVFEIFDVPKKEEKKVKFSDKVNKATSVKSEEYDSEEDAEDSDEGDGFANTAHEIAQFETELNQF